MIGNDIQINKFSETIDETILYLPIPFWNLSNYGLAFPLISLQYNSLQIKINTKKFLDCIKINYDKNIFNENINNEIINILINNLSNVIKSKLDITLLFEYIYLDSIERNKFACSAHEYLIEQLQEIEFNGITSTDNTKQLELFQCCKDMFWFIKKIPNQNDIFNNDPNVFTYIYSRPIIIPNENIKTIIDYSLMLFIPEILFNPFIFYNGLYVINNNIKYLEQVNLIIQNYSNKFIFPSSYVELNKIILESSFNLNGVQLFGETSNYFNYLQPYIYYNATPQLGLNVYSFCLKPTEFQPSGSCNMSRISFIGLKLKINEKKNDPLESTLYTNEINYLKIDEEYELIFQTRNYNVLRIIGGIGATAYTY